MERVVFSIFHTTDIHGRFSKEKVYKIKDILADCDTKRVLVDSGDILKGGNILFYPFENTFRYIDNLKYTAICLGNREFNYFRSVLYSRLNKYPFIACNIVDKRLRTQKILPSIHMVIDFFRITIIGLTKPQYEQGSFWEVITGFSFVNIFDCITEQIEKYYKLTDLFIILSHLGIEGDLKLGEFIAMNYSNIMERFIVLGGHDHKEFFSDKFVPILHTKPHLSSISRIEFIFKCNKSHKIVGDIILERIDL